ncbi:MAG: Kae1-associated serine/threonine protein kinase [Nanoarchaeota archaeon]|nr:Kae1-associated serine/threonine protein kinase [Nanoarchaeota archaeon]
MELLSYGAEAQIEILNENTLKKIRTIQEYRHPQLDKRIRKKRTKREFKVLQKLFLEKLHVPKVDNLNLEECSFEMQYIQGKCIVENMNTNYLSKAMIQIAKIHKLGIVHCDLTPLNMLIKDDEIYLIDFGLSEYSKDREERAVDLNVFFIFLKNDYSELYENKEELLNIYREEFNDDVIVDEIFTRLEEVEKRGRNKNK